MDDIDYSIILHKHSWTTFSLYLKGKVHEIGISSVLSNPLNEFAQLLLSLLNGENEVEIRLFNEPGWHMLRAIRDRKEQHMLVMEIGYNGDLKPVGFEKEVEFSVEQKQFVIIGLFQLKKIYHLLQEKSFAKDRKGEFPYSLYQKLMMRAAQVYPDIV